MSRTRLSNSASRRSIKRCLSSAIVLDQVNRAAVRAGRLFGCHEDALDKSRRVRLTGDEPREIEQLRQAAAGILGSHGVSIRQAEAPCHALRWHESLRR